MKICFIIKSQNLNTGSYRIFVHDLNNYFNKNNIESAINPRNINDYDIHIYGKGDYNIKNSRKINGSINPSSDCNVLNQFNFIIVGSCEEKESMITKNKNIFLFPLIEKMYLDTIPKTHISKDEIVIGYAHRFPNNVFLYGFTDIMFLINYKDKHKLLSIPQKILELHRNKDPRYTIAEDPITDFFYTNWKKVTPKWIATRDISILRPTAA